MTVTKIDLAAGTNELDEDVTGTLVHYNLDDDNLSDPLNILSTRPGADFDEVTNPVTGENDLKQASFSFGGAFGDLPTEGKITLTTVSGIKVWKSAIKGGTNLVMDSDASKTWDLSLEAQRTDFSTVKISLYIEGVAANVASSLTATYERQVEGAWQNVGVDKVKYDIVASDVGAQPKTVQGNTPYYGPDGTQGWYITNDDTGQKYQFYTDPNKRRRWKSGFPSLQDCEWSITDNRWTLEYNCIGASIDQANVWYYPVTSGHHINVIGIATTYGNQDGVFNLDKMDAFYMAKKG